MHRLIFVLSLAVFLHADEGRDIPLLRWVDPEGSTPGTCEEWRAEHPYTPFYSSLLQVHYGDGRLGSIAILTEQSLVSPLDAKIEQLGLSLTQEGYTVYEYEISGGTPETLRTFLAGVCDTYDIEGALFIGNLPVAWFEVIEWSSAYAQFPMDLFYMDLDGTWLDTMNTGNGKYDGHTGNIDPEIYVGRLMPTGIGVDTVVLCNYFEKDNAYRYGTMDLPKRALVFVDDDWQYYAYQWGGDVALLYPDTAFFWQPETTRASLYRPELDSSWAWVSVFAHSSPSIHQFAYNNGSAHDYYYATEYTTQNPPANFYNFFACSFSRYTQSGYGGGRAIFNDDYGLGSIGSTKTGSMLDFNYFYAPLADSSNLGEAFKDWFYQITHNGVTLDELWWHYGMTLLGDPFLRPTGHATLIAEHSSDGARSFDIRVTSPASDRVMFTVELSNREHVRVAIYDCLGRRVREVFDGVLESGVNTLSVDAVDRHGARLATGVYLVSVAGGTGIATKKFVKI